MAKKVYGARALLNQPGYESIAAICAEIFPASYGGWNCEVSISDCNRSVTLNFAGPTAGEDGHANDLYKIDALVYCLREFRKGLVLLNKKHRENA